MMYLYEDYLASCASSERSGTTVYDIIFLPPYPCPASGRDNDEPYLSTLDWIEQHCSVSKLD